MRLAEGTLLMSVNFEGQKLVASDQTVATGVSAATGTPDRRAKNAVSLGVFDLFGSTREFCQL
jgi:hypothetical protein